MTNNVNRFCDSIHERLETLQGRMDSLKLNVGTTWHSLQEKLEEVRHKGKESKQAVTEARIDLEKWVGEHNAELKSTIDQWIENHETQKLDARAKRAEERALLAIKVAQSSIDDAERMILEAITAKLDAEAVMAG